MVSDSSVSALINISALVKRIPPHLLCVQQSLPRVLQLRPGSHSKAEAVSRSKILPPQRPGSLFLSEDEEGQFPAGQVERKYLSRSRNREKKKSSHLAVCERSWCTNGPHHFVQRCAGHRLGKEGKNKKKEHLFSCGPLKVYFAFTHGTSRKK